MEITIYKPTKVNVKYIKAEIQPRYLEDTTFIIDGVEVNDNEQNPKIAGYSIDFDHEEFCAEDYLITWIIDVDEGRIINWNGLYANIHYKVVDQGKYSLLDKNQNIKCTGGYGQYVPSIFSIDDNGYGDYIIMTVDKNGYIKYWYANSIKLNDSSFGTEVK